MSEPPVAPTPSAAATHAATQRAGRWLRLPALGLRERIVFGFVGLLLVTLLATLGIVGVATERSAHAQLRQRLDVGERVLGQLLAADAERLAESVSLLARDFAFREAVATGDLPTVQSALLNHGQRIDAELAVLLGNDGRLLASVDAQRAAALETALARLLRSAEDRERASAVIAIDGKPYLVALVPVLAPRRVGWAAFGVPLGDADAARYRGILGLDVAFVETTAAGTLAVRAATLPPQRRTALAARPAAGLQGEAQLGEHAYALRPLAIDQGIALAPDAAAVEAGAATPGALRALLLADLDEALRPNRVLLRQVGALSGLAALAMLMLAMLIGGGIARPVARLAEAAQRVRDGDYAEPLPVRGQDDLAALAASFNGMQAGIAEREARIRHQASHDALTGLPNRALALRRLESAILAARAQDTPCAALMVDLERLKEINDTLGHAFGDAVLRSVAERLRVALGAHGMLARLDGDEFIALLEGADEAAATARAQGLLDALEAPFAAGPAQARLGANIGIAVYPQHAQDATTLLRRADIAMYDAKAQHARMAVYRSGRDEHHLRQVALMGDLRFARERGELSLAFQPKIDLRSGRVAHAEVLLRWRHPEHGPVRPDEFIALAERSGAIGALTRFVLEQAIAQAAPWVREGLIQAVAVNLSPMDLRDAALPEFVEAMLAAHGMEGRSLILEVTESSAMRDPAQSIQIMQRLRRSGARMSIDDFGTGHSSLAYLRSLPVDEIKIDKSFVMGLGSGRDDAVIVRSTIEIAHKMGLTVIAEGVEDAGALGVLRGLGCDMGQGYHFTAPLPAEAFVEWCAGFAAPEHAA